MEYGVLKADLTRPPFEEIEVLSEHCPAILLVEPEFSPLLQQGVEHGGINEEENVCIELRHNLVNGGRGRDGFIGLSEKLS